MLAGVVASCLISPLIAYLTIERPADAFSVRWALFILLLGCGVIIASGWLQRSRPESPYRHRTILGNNLVGLVIAFVAANWWMAALAGFTGLIASVFAGSETPPTE